MKLSEAMRRMLIDVRDHQDPFHRVYGKNQSFHGGAQQTVKALVKHKLITLDHKTLTPLGRELLGKTPCDDCGVLSDDLITKGDHHGGQKTVCRDRDACHRRSPG